MGKQMLAQPQVQFPASVWERAGPAKCRRGGLKQQGPERRRGKEMAILKMKRVRPERQEDLEAAGRTTENNDERKTRSLNRRG